MSRRPTASGCMPAWHHTAMQGHPGCYDPSRMLLQSEGWMLTRELPAAHSQEQALRPGPLVLLQVLPARCGAGTHGQSEKDRCAAGGTSPVLQCT